MPGHRPTGTGAPDPPWGPDGSAAERLVSGDAGALMGLAANDNEAGDVSLSEATGPIRDSIIEMQASTQSMRETSERTESILRHTHEVIEAPHIAVQDGLRTLDRSVTQFRDGIGRYREIDDQLDEAFHKIETDVQASIEEIGAFKQKVNEEFGRALNRLEAVIQQAEPFVPESKE